MQSRLALIAFGGLGASFAGWNYLSSSSSNSSSSSRNNSISQQEACKNLPIYKRFIAFASATEKQQEGEGSVVPCMTIYDFIDSLTTSEGKNSNKKDSTSSSSPKYSQSQHTTQKQLDEIFAKNPQIKNDFDKLIALVDTDGSGTIDFHEYATLQTLLASPVEQLKGAVELFDRSNSQRVNVRQFKALLRSMSSGHLGAGNAASSSSHESQEKHHALGDGTSSLAKFFFGEKGDQTVSFQDFLGRVSEIRRLVRAIEFQLALNENNKKNQQQNQHSSKTSLDSIRYRLTGVEPSSSSSSSTTTISTLIDSKAPLIDVNDYMVFMALLAVSDQWTPALKLFLENNPEKNQITYPMLSRVLCDVDISSVIPPENPMAKGLNIEPSRGDGHHIRVFSTKHQADAFSQLMDQNSDGTIDVNEVRRIARAHNSFFAAFVPQFKEAPRNVIQQWFYCMQQKA